MEFKLLRHAFYAVALLLPVVAAAETKIGYVNLTEILEKSPQADAARKTLEKGIFIPQREAYSGTGRNPEVRGNTAKGWCRNDGDPAQRA